MTYAIAVLSYSVELNAAEPAAPIKLLPAGAFRSVDGRPAECPAWVCTAADAQRVINAANAQKRSIVIDYEHQTLNSEKNGLPAPASGWFKDMEWREGDGLWASAPEWTDKARQMIADGEYKYLSPVFAYDKNTGAVLKLLHAALTNFPALDDLPEVALRAAAHFQHDQFLENVMPEWLKKLLMSLGIDPDNEQAATAALTGLKTKADSAAAKESEIVALRAKAEAAATGNPDQAKFVPVETMTALQTQVAALTAKVNGRDVEDVIEGARKAGKLLEAQVTWARELGNKDIAALRSFVDSAPAVAALSQMQTGGHAPGGSANEGGLSEAELAVCKSMGIAPEDFKKTQKADAA